MKKLTGLIVLVTAMWMAAGFGACSTPEFDDFYNVYDLRILAVRLDPPEMLYDQLKCTTVVGEGEEARPTFDPACLPEVTTTVTVLAADPRLGKDDRMFYDLNGCVLNGLLECRPEQVNEHLGTTGGGVGGVSLEVTFTPELLQQSYDADPFFGFYGFAVWMDGSAASTMDHLGFVRSFTMSPSYEGFDEFDITRPPNTNPEIIEIRVGDKDEEVPVELDDAGAYVVEVGEEYRLLPVHGAEDKETYEVLALKTEELLDDFIRGGELDAKETLPEIDELVYKREITEELTVQFYGTCGEYEKARKSDEGEEWLHDEDDLDDINLSDKWTAPDEPEECTLWFVITDGRGGTGWYELPVSVVAATQ